jgi:hypothetical protein
MNKLNKKVKNNKKQNFIELCKYIKYDIIVDEKEDKIYDVLFTLNDNQYIYDNEDNEIDTSSKVIEEITDIDLFVNSEEFQNYISMYINEIQDIIYNDNTSNFTQEEKNRIIE